MRIERLLSKMKNQALAVYDVLYAEWSGTGVISELHDTASIFFAKPSTVLGGSA